MAAVAAAVVRVVVPLLVVAAVERARDEVARPESEPMVEIEALLKPRPKVGKALLSSWFPLRLVRCRRLGVGSCKPWVPEKPSPRVTC